VSLQEHEHLAHLVGASRKTVAEELGKMRRQGIVSTAYRSIALENMPELAGHS
jgi:CRP-like cAMP-binding protein